MHRHAQLILLLGPVAAGCLRATDSTGGGSASPVPPPVREDHMPANQPQPAAPASRFTGTLRGGGVAIGAETTGWVLETEQHGRLDVDVSRVADAASELDGKPVVIEGSLVKVNWVERGEKTLLMADAIRLADAGE